MPASCVSDFLERHAAAGGVLVGWEIHNDLAVTGFERVSSVGKQEKSSWERLFRKKGATLFSLSAVYGYPTPCVDVCTIEVLGVFPFRPRSAMGGRGLVGCCLEWVCVPLPDACRGAMLRFTRPRSCSGPTFRDEKVGC